jgi:hypothetical protein
MPAVTADVHEGSQDAVSRASNYNGNLAGDRGEEGALIRDLSGMADVLPRTREDPLPLAPQDFGVGVPRPGQRRLHGCEL